jgi:hypothetical protein
MQTLIEIYILYGCNNNMHNTDAHSAACGLMYTCTLLRIMLLSACVERTSTVRYINELQLLLTFSVTYLANSYCFPQLL